MIGISLTLLIGWGAIAGLRRYRERQKALEAMTDEERREQLGYERGLARWAKGVCPGCERRVDLKDGMTYYFPRCGMGLFGKCRCCSGRKSTFNRFCFACGIATLQAPAD